MNFGYFFNQSIEGGNGVEASARNQIQLFELMSGENTGRDRLTRPGLSS